MTILTSSVRRATYWSLTVGLFGAIAFYSRAPRHPGVFAVFGILAGLIYTLTAENDEKIEVKETVSLTFLKAFERWFWTGALACLLALISAGDRPTTPTVDLRIVEQGDSASLHQNSRPQ